MTTPKDLPFASVIAKLFNDDVVPVHLVYRLSDLTVDEFKLFQREWSEVSEERRAALVRHMSDISEENFIVDFAPLFAYLIHDRYPLVRLAALDGLWDADDTDLISPIIKLLQSDPDVTVRAGAARALAHYVLMGEWGEITPEVVAPIVEALVAEHERPQAPLEVKRATLEAMSAAVHPRIPNLINDAYEEGSNDLQLSALFAMGISADQRWLSILEDEMSSPSADFRAEAARAAGNVGSTDSVDALEQLLGDEEIEVAMAAVYALGQIGGSRATELLQRAAEDPDFEELYDAIDEALEEMDWMGGNFDLLSFSEDDDDEEVDDLRAN